MVLDEGKTSFTIKKRSADKPFNAPTRDTSQKKSAGFFGSFTSAVRRVFGSTNTTNISDPGGDFHKENKGYDYQTRYTNYWNQATGCNTSSESDSSTYCDIELESLDTASESRITDKTSETTPSSTGTKNTSSLEEYRSRLRRDIDNTYPIMDMNISFPSDNSTCTTVSMESGKQSACFPDNEYHHEKLPKDWDVRCDDERSCGTYTFNNVCSELLDPEKMYNSIVDELDFVWHERHYFNGTNKQS